MSEVEKGGSRPPIEHSDCEHVFSYQHGCRFVYCPTYGIVAPVGKSIDDILSRGFDESASLATCEHCPCWDDEHTYRSGRPYCLNCAAFCDYPTAAEIAWSRYLHPSNENGLGVHPLLRIQRELSPIGWRGAIRRCISVLRGYVARAWVYGSAVYGGSSYTKLRGSRGVDNGADPTRKRVGTVADGSLVSIGVDQWIAEDVK
jgi:hypothetical protein